MSVETKTERVLRDVLNSDNLRDLLSEDVVNNAMKWRFLQAALYVLDGHGLLGDPETAKDATPAPLDPSKVKAGDTVTLLVDPPDTHPAFTVAGETHSLGGPTVYLGGWRVDDLPDYVTLTDHQPAPEPGPEWKPGTIGTAGTVRGLGYTGPVVRTDEHLLPWWTPSRVDGAHYHGEETVTDFVPDEPRPLPTRDDLARVMHDDYLPNGEPRLGRTHREILADAVLAHLRGESR